MNLLVTSSQETYSFRCLKPECYSFHKWFQVVHCVGGPYCFPSAEILFPSMVSSKCTLPVFIMVVSCD